VVGRELILRDKLALECEEFDYVLMDCPPSLGILTINALSAVDDVLLPLQPHYLALHGLSKLLQTIDLVA
ncbi:MAG TPA: chromosome partitioning protein ParA, partial [Planctomycetaceae bacterium]|nr:chromosome partitioning protein ParA [Planctomycetaceae bacterium]